MRIKYILLVTLVCVSIIFALLADKNTILSFFIVDSETFVKPDLIVLLEGGAIDFSPTIERANRTIELYSKYPANILVCSYAAYKPGLLKYLIKNGVNPKDLTKTLYEYRGKRGGGTYNNVLEIISVLKENDNYQRITIVTSPYHELRVSKIYSTLINESKINRHVSVSYSNIQDSEIIYANTSRFTSVIAHEVLGLLGFYFMLIQDKVIIFRNKYL